MLSVWELTYYLRRIVLSFWIWSLVSRSYQTLCIRARIIAEIIGVVIVSSAFYLFYRAADL